MEVVEIVTSGAQGLDAAARIRPDLILVDLGLPDENGLVIGQKLSEMLPEARIVAVTALNDGKAVRQALRSGFHGYLTKDAQVKQFVNAISTVLDGQVVVPRPAVRRMAGARTPEEQQAVFLAEQLTPREREILALLAEGSDGVDIARKLSVSKNTVRTHVQNILSKLQVHSRLEAAAFAIRYGLVDPPGRTTTAS